MKSMLFVDDHPMYREGVRRTLSAALPDLQTHTAADARSALAVLDANPNIDLCLADYRLPDGDGLTLIAEVRRRFPLIAIGLLCAEPSLGLVAKARLAGAVACLSKERDTEALATALDQLFAGGEVFDDKPLPASHYATLSIRRRELLMLAADGLLDKQIGERLGITESTVRSHWQQIFMRLDASNRTEAVTKALRLGLI
jgi:DNA-binding NarL/FixJ family response regulator